MQNYLPSLGNGKEEAANKEKTWSLLLFAINAMLNLSITLKLGQPSEFFLWVFFKTVVITARTTYTQNKNTLMQLEL